MTTQPIPCQQNNDISLDELNRRIAAAEDRLEHLVEIDAGADVIQEQRDEVADLRRQYHPDHWFIDPQASPVKTEEGRQRRRAKQACWADCPMRARLLCLDLGLQPGHTLSYGIYGGYTEKERQAIVEETEKKRRERDAQRAEAEAE